ncbi:Peptidoglycan/LPS O-acetylase OafA/YrhL, contains acyltransferase and SGNH-hydrolase domains [Bradyrhizobium lablabi]|uniref:Peptidoglycan/LPS O-acetylase OafA/YrhL, contains acyltransferase and SGNH-hydrolase domains n=1 Tax=Bradyrhizobium lablabi TaxID=722472 RepID=A0A1M7BEK9_9BRAD|nr:acyltransferase [Bradyrhizobium lablabi]SHL53387.1 Peptidoglycan/LPS O-acetylase OafA/YrhL, contains acyltransferase and SGNH-hydrolase domains [Bradyrhizobium lablabi]
MHGLTADEGSNRAKLSGAEKALAPGRPVIEQRKYDFVDALRGIAVLLVVLAHTPLQPSLTFLNVIGAYGVQLFFVVSAFTLFLSIEAKHDRETRPVLFFFIRRFFRIAPAFYLAALFYLTKDGLGPTPFAPDGIHAWQILSTFAFVNGWFPDAINTVVPGGWSIAVEMTFYVFVPVCFSLITSVVRAIALTVALAILGMAANRFVAPLLLAPFADDRTILVWFPQLWFPIQASVFPIGFIVFLLFTRHSALPARWSGVLTFIAIAALFVAPWVHAPVAPLPLFYAVIFGLLCYGMSSGGPRVLVNPLLCHVGRVSFSVYLLHFWAISLVHRYLEPAWLGVNPPLQSLLFYTTTVAAAVAMSNITFRCIELPGQKIGRALIARIEREAGAQAQLR